MFFQKGPIISFIFLPRQGSNTVRFQRISAGVTRQTSIMLYIHIMQPTSYDGVKKRTAVLGGWGVGFQIQIWTSGAGDK